MKISIVCTYWNRKQQLINTLRSIELYNHPVEIIIVDDCSTDGDDITHLANEFIKVITLKDKTWINPCIAFNTGFKEATGDIVIIQNAECYHVGDIIEYTLANIRKGLYLSFSALAVNSEIVKGLTLGGDAFSLAKPYMKNKIDVDGWNGNGWYNHPTYRPGGYHFCCAIMREDLYDLGGFDERYADGLGFDDNELLTRIIEKKCMGVKIVEFPFVLHQEHPKFQPGDVTNLMGINALKWDATRHSEEYDMKKYNTIYV